MKNKEDCLKLKIRYDELCKKKVELQDYNAPKEDMELHLSPKETKELEKISSELLYECDLSDAEKEKVKRRISLTETDQLDS